VAVRFKNKKKLFQSVRCCFRISRISRIFRISRMAFRIIKKCK